MSVREEIAKSLLYYRKKAGYSQKEFAELLGVNNSAVCNWENGRNSIDIEKLFKACEILGVSINEMYGAYANIEEYTEHEKSVITAYRERPELQPVIDKLLDVSDPQA